MRLTFQSLLALVVPILILLFLFSLVFDWHVNYAAFRSDLALGAVGLGVLTLFVLTMLNPGAPTAFRHDMFEGYYSGAKHVAKGPDGTAGLASSKAHRTFTSSVGGHVARFAGILQQLIERGVGVSPRLTLLRVGA